MHACMHALGVLLMSIRLKIIFLYYAALHFKCRQKYYKFILKMLFSLHKFIIMMIQC